MDRGKVEALAAFLNASTSEIKVEGRESAGVYSHYDSEFLVLDDAEADEAVQEHIELQVGPRIDKIKDISVFTHELIASKGRGAFLAVDGEENTEDYYFIYRLN